MQETILQYLQMLQKFSNNEFANFILTNGRQWETQALPEDFQRGIPKECFSNSQQLLLEHHVQLLDESLTYVEGFACHAGGLNFPVHHGWLVDEHQRVVDVTWNNPKDSAYFGVPFQTSYVLEQVRNTNMWSSLLDNPYNRHALVRGTHSVVQAIETFA